MPEHTIAENLTRLQNAKTAICNAITAKGGTVAASDGLEEFAADIATITNQYTAGDEGKVVSGGQLVAQTDYGTVTENGTYDTTLNNSVTVNVSSAQTLEVIKCTTTMTIYGDPPNVNYFIILDRFNKKITFYFYAGRTPVTHKKVTGSHTYEFSPEFTLSDIMSTVSTDFYTINRNKSTSGTSETDFVNSGDTYPAVDLTNNKIIVDFGTANSYDYIVYIAGFSYT